MSDKLNVKVSPSSWFREEFLPWINFIISSLTNACVFVVMLAIAFVCGITFHDWQSKETVLVELCTKVVAEAKENKELSSKRSKMARK